MSAWRGLYVITDSDLIPADQLIHRVAQALAAGAVAVQYRDKRLDPASRRAQAGALLALCREHGVPLIINDDVALAAQIGADGVHLGRDDLCLAEARARLGGRALIGVSCYNRLELARAAEQAGADYVAFGSFFPSRTKPDAVRADPQLLRAARVALRIPVAAIGGITPENGAALVEAGADLLAVIQGVFGQGDVAQAARRYAELFNREV